MEIKIMVAAHKESQMPQDNLYLPVHVGKALHQEKELGYQSDAEGENISEKNPYYCEMTAMYWGWKNLKCDYIGLVHYRRHFSLKPVSNGGWGNVLTSEQAKELCKKHDIILPKRRNLYIETVYSHYDHTFYGEQFDKAREIIRRRCPEYLAAFDVKMKSRHEHLFNMFIMRKDLFDAYCSWVFPILGELEGCYNLKDMDAFQARLIGRVGERLLDVWINKNGLKYKEIGYVYFGKSNMHKKIWGFLMAAIFHKRYKQSF